MICRLRRKELLHGRAGLIRGYECFHRPFERTDRWRVASVPKGNPGDRSVLQGWQIRPSLLLSSKAQLSWKLPHVSDRDGNAQTRSGPQTGNWRGWQTDYQLDPASPDFMRTGYCGGDGRPNRFADGP